MSLGVYYEYKVYIIEVCYIKIREVESLSYVSDIKDNDS